MPTAYAQSITISGPTQACAGDTIVLIASGGSGYSWSEIYNTNILSQEATLTVVLQRTMTYRVTTTSGIATFTVTALPAPAVPFGLSSSLKANLLAYFPLNCDDFSWGSQQFYATPSLSPPTTTTDRFGNVPGGRQFSFAGQFLNTNVSMPSGNKSMSFWAKSDQVMTSGSGIMVGFSAPTSQRFYLGYNNGQYWSGIGEVASPFAPMLQTSTEWHHYVLVCEGNIGRVYQNGVLASTFSHNGLSGGNGNSLQIGRGGGTDNVAFAGAVDDVFFYNRALTLEDVTDLYNATRPVEVTLLQDSLCETDFTTWLSFNDRQEGVLYQLIDVDTGEEVAPASGGCGSIPIAPMPAATTTFRVHAQHTQTNCTFIYPELHTLTIFPQITFDTLPDISICPGDTVTFSLPEMPISYGWRIDEIGTDPTNINIIWSEGDQSNTFRFLPLSSSVGTFQVVLAASGPRCEYRDTALVVIAPLPLADAGADQVVCVGTSVTLGTLPPPGSNFDYTWSSPEFLNDPTLPQPTFTATAGVDTLLYTYVVTVTDNTSGCQQTDSVQVRVLPAPVNNAGPDVTLCSGDTAMIGSEPIAGHTYLWLTASGLTDTTSALTTVSLENDTPTVDTLFYVREARLGNCTSLDTVRVIVQPDPARSLSPISGGVSVCPNVEGVTYTVTNPQNHVLWWQAEGGQITTQQGNSITVNWGDTRDDAKVFVSPTSEFGCKGDTLELTVRINVELTVATPIGPNVLCPEDASVHTYETQFIPASQYTWNVAGGDIIAGQGSFQVTVNWTGQEQGVVWVEKLSVTSTDTCFGRSDSLFVNFLPGAFANPILLGSDTACSGEGVTFTVQDDSLPRTYEWRVAGDTTLFIETGNAFAFQLPIVNTLAQYIVSVQEITAEGCRGSLMSRTLAVFPLPQTQPLTFESVICTIDTVVYQVAPTPNHQYNWLIAGGDIVSGQGTPKIQVVWRGDSTPLLEVVETSSTGCNSDTLGFPLQTDFSQPALRVVGFDLAEDNLLRVAFALTGAENFPENILRLQRRTDASPLWETLLETVASTSPLQISAPDESTFEYRIQTINQCSVELFSAAHRPIALDATVINDEEIGLRWTSYVPWEPGVNYEVSLSLDGRDRELIQVTTDTSLIIFGYNSRGFDHCYRVRAVFESEESWSRNTCLSIDNPLLIPNVFTPNGDGINDTFHLSPLHLYPNTQLRIVDRWGKEVFSDNDYSNNWRGQGNHNQILPDGTYFYHLLNASYNRKGWVQILR